MFDMAKQVSPHEQGYRLVIHYNANQKQYHLTGYSVRIDANNKLHLDQDGAALSFNSLEDAIKHITEYPEG